MRGLAVVVLALSLGHGVLPALAQGNGTLPKPSAALVRSLHLLERDLGRLQDALPEPQTRQPSSQLTPELLALVPPPANTWPTQTEQVAIRQELRLELEQAVALAVRNDPDLAESLASVAERQARSAASSGRLWPRFDLDLRGGFAQHNQTNMVLQDNAGLYPAHSPFLVQPNGGNSILSNLSYGAAAMRVDWELISFERNAELAQSKQELEAARSRYGNRLRELQLDISLAYYTLQLAQQLKRVRQVQMASDTVVLGEVKALKQSGLVPRLDLLRAEAQLQQSRMKLEQAEALSRSRQRQLSNLINVPYSTTINATEAVRLQPPWPLDLQQTLIQGFTANPELMALDAARRALISQANRHAAELLPRLHLFAAAGAEQQLLTKPVIDLQGCCSSAQIPQLGSQNSDWAAGLRLQWRLFDGGTS
ncbi:MAG: TolC family protein, partial [Cyanobacteria bacterium K_DeepCast_35m_m2_023]|nr:TolC family protein [Cyanobacteria bacterium K_DeepCast_35m_m2_023]